MFGSVGLRDEAANPTYMGPDPVGDPVGVESMAICVNIGQPLTI